MASLDFDTLSQVQAGNTNANIQLRLPLAEQVQIIAATAIFSAVTIASGQDTTFNIVYGEGPETGSVPLAGAVATLGQQVFATDQVLQPTDQGTSNAGNVLSFVVPAPAYWPAYADLTLRISNPTTVIQGVKIGLLTAVQTTSNQTYNVPVGYTAEQAIAMVQLRTNEPSLPSAQNMLQFLNAGVEVVTGLIGGIRTFGTFPTVANQTTQALTPDIQEILSASWSTGAVTAAGSLVYPMQQLDQGAFMDNAAGFPAISYGVPQWFWLYQDENQTMQLQMYPAAMLGQLNIYYLARPQLWQLASGVTSYYTNLDSLAQEAVILWTCARVLEYRGRSMEAMQVFMPQFKEKIEDLKSIIMKRSAPKGGVVRDVRNRSYPNSPWGF